MAIKRRSWIFIPTLLAGCAIAGGIFGPRVQIASAATSDDDVRNSTPKEFTRVYSHRWIMNSADPVNADKAIYNGAIPGMLRTLDPHSNFFDPKALALMREDQQGRYYGIGMTVVGRNGKVIVVAPFVDSPAYKAGLKPNDIPG